MANREVIEQSGRTVDDAVQTALRRLGLTRAQVEVEVLEEGRTGIFGIGHAQSLVRVTPRQDAPPSRRQSDGPALPKIDDYADLTELEPGQRGSRQGGARSSGGRGGPGRRTVTPASGSSNAEVAAPDRSSDSGSRQREAQPDHRSRSRRSQPSGESGGRRDRGRGRQDGRNRGRQRPGRSEERQQAPRAPIGPFELLADPEFEPNEDPRSFAVEVLTDIVRQLGFDVSVVARDPKTPMDGLGHAVAVLDVEPLEGEDLGLLIGRHGAHVAALQYVVNVIVSRALDGNNPITVDVDGYRRRRETALVEMAQRAASEVRDRGEAVTLGVMPAAERRIIHLQLQDDPELKTESFGEGASRRVRILYRED